MNEQVALPRLPWLAILKYVFPVIDTPVVGTKLNLGGHLGIWLPQTPFPWVWHVLRLRPSSLRAQDFMRQVCDSSCAELTGP